MEGSSETEADCVVLLSRDVEPELGATVVVLVLGVVPTLFL